MFIKFPLGALMVFGGCSIPSTGGFGCSASVHSQMVSIHQLRPFLESHVLEDNENCLRRPMTSMGVKGLRGNMVTSVRSGF